MPSTTGRDKDLPMIPMDRGAAVVDKGPCTVPSLKVTMYADTNKALPSIDVERVLSKEDIIRFHELWNEAGLSARAHRRKQRDQAVAEPTQRRIPPPITIPEPGNTPPTSAAPSKSADLAVTSATTPTPGSRKRWGFFSARTNSETQEAQQKNPRVLDKLRTMAQDRLRKSLRNAKSAPNLGDRATSCRRKDALLPIVPATPVRVASKKAGPCSGTRSLASPSEPPKPEPKAVPQREDVDETAIYFTMNPNWRASRGSAELVPITEIPDSPTSLGRPDSPLLHRHYSLDQLSFAAMHATDTLPARGYPSNAVLRPIDEWETFLEL